MVSKDNNEPPHLPPPVAGPQEHGRGAIPLSDKTPFAALCRLASTAVFTGTALLVLGCAQARPVAPPPPALRPIPESSQGWARPAQVGESYYTTQPTPDPTRGGAEADQLARDLVDMAQAQGLTLVGDGRMAALGEWIADQVGADGKAPPSVVFDFGARHFGIAEETPLVVVLAGGTPKERTDYLVQALASLPKNLTYNRFGIASQRRDRMPLNVVVLCASLVDLQPVPRMVPAGQPIVLRGKTHQQFQQYEVVVTRPDGSVQPVSKGKAGAFEATLALAGVGVHRVEVLASGSWGHTVVANFPLYVGTQPPQAVALPPADTVPPSSPTAESAQTELLHLLNNTRREAGVAPVSILPSLSRVAEAHSKDMADQGFFGHVSPTTGDPSARVRGAGLRFSLIAENVACAQSAADVHRALLDSPGHRANILNPKLTHVGMGVVVKPRQGQWDVFATELFARLVQPVDLRSASDRLLTTVNATRKGQNLTPLQLDPLLSQAAARGAGLYFSPPTNSKEQVLDQVMRELQQQAKTGNGNWKHIRTAEGYIGVGPALDEVGTYSSISDKTARYVGIGVAQGTRPDGPDNMIAVVMVVAWPKQ